MILVCHFSSIYLYLRTKSLYASQRRQLTADPDFADARSITNAISNGSPILNAVIVANGTPVNSPAPVYNPAPVNNSAPEIPNSDTNPLFALIKSLLTGTANPRPMTDLDAASELDAAAEAPETAPPPSARLFVRFKTLLKSSFISIAANITGPPEWLKKTATSLIVFGFMIGLLGFLLSFCK